VTLSLTGTGGGGPHRVRSTPAKNSISARSPSGQRITLSSLAGRPVIVELLASWCAPCQKETPMLARFAKHTSVRSSASTSNDQTRPALAFVHKTGVTYPVATETAMAAPSSPTICRDCPQPSSWTPTHRIVKRVYGRSSQAELTSGPPHQQAGEVRLSPCPPRPGPIPACPAPHGGWPVQKAPRWLLVAGALVLAGAVLTGLRHITPRGHSAPPT